MSLISFPAQSSHTFRLRDYRRKTHSASRGGRTPWLWCFLGRISYVACFYKSTWTYAVACIMILFLIPMQMVSNMAMTTNLPCITISPSCGWLVTPAIQYVKQTLHFLEMRTHVSNYPTCPLEGVGLLNAHSVLFLKLKKHEGRRMIGIC